MKILSALEDFMLHTIAAVPGTWNRLRFTAGLRGRSGEYEHWGMTRTYGADAAQQAMRSAHQEVFLEVLRTPLSELFEELHGPGSEEIDAALSRALAPEGVDDFYALHLAWICESLRAVETAGRLAQRAA
jgi:hypothetical protein